METIFVREQSRVQNGIYNMINYQNIIYNYITYNTSYYMKHISYYMIYIIYHIIWSKNVILKIYKSTCKKRECA